MKCVGEVEYLTSHGVERVKARKVADRNAVISSRSQMIEVCSESSFQPLLQLYLFLPTLITGFRCQAAFSFNHSVQDWFSNVSGLQFWSILTSCISLSWSFNFHQSVKKDGALDFGANPVGRILLLLSNILQISGRLIVFVLLAYCFGDGNFWPMFAGVLGHVGLMSTIYYQLTRQERNNQVRPPTIFQSLYQSLINGIANLYLWNHILPLPRAGHRTMHTHRKSFQHQAIVDSICTMENVIVVIMAFIFVDDIPVELLMYGVGGHLSGLLLKYAYYYKFHIWSSVLELETPINCCG